MKNAVIFSVVPKLPTLYKELAKHINVTVDIEIASRASVVVASGESATKLFSAMRKGKSFNTVLIINPTRCPRKLSYFDVRDMAVYADVAHSNIADNFFSAHYVSVVHNTLLLKVSEIMDLVEDLIGKEYNKCSIQSLTSKPLDSTRPTVISSNSPTSISMKTLTE